MESLGSVWNLFQWKRLVDSLQCSLNSLSPLAHVWLSATVQPVEVRGQPQGRLFLARYFT